MGLAGLTSHDHGTGYQLSTNALTGKLLQGPGNTREQRGMHGSISSFGDDSAHKKRAQRAQQHTHPSARASHLPSPTPPPCSTTVALRQLGAYTCLQHASAFERRSTRPTHRLPHSPHTRERRRPHAHDARHASALRASHSFGRAPSVKRFQALARGPLASAWRVGESAALSSLLGAAGYALVASRRCETHARAERRRDSHWQAGAAEGWLRSTGRAQPLPSC